MKILVSGARGFVGINVARSLALAGHDVIAVDRSPEDRWVREFLRGLEPRIVQVSADLSMPGALEGALPDSPVDACVHAAVITATTVDVEVKHARDIVDSNVGGTVEMLQTALARGARRFVYVSSPSAFGNADATSLIAEDVGTNPGSLYGITKLASELIVERWGELQPVETVSVRIAQPYGPGERATNARVRTSPIWEWLRDIEKGEPLPTGPQDRSRDWTYVEDTARGIATLATSATLGHNLYHLSTGKDVRIAEVIEAFEAAIGPISIDESPPADALNPNISGEGRQPLDPHRFEGEFGWRPSTGIADGLSRYVTWWTEFKTRIGQDERG